MRSRVIVLLAVMLFQGLAASAFTFEPITQDFTPSGPGAVRNFRLENEGGENVPIRIRVFTREVDEYGKETNLPADGLFVVYPSQVVLKPRSVQNIRVQWKGPSSVETERAFRILVEQMPVDFSGQPAAGSQIRIMFRYLGALYVVPPKPRHEVVLESLIPGTDSEGKSVLNLVFRNRGNAHIILGDLKLSLRRDDLSEQPLVFSPDSLPGISVENILSGNARRFVLPVPERYAHAATKLSFTFDPVR
jgi:fimbrial chaperone protein